MGGLRARGLRCMHLVTIDNNVSAFWLYITRTYNNIFFCSIAREKMGFVHLLRLCFVHTGSRPCLRNSPFLSIQHFYNKVTNYFSLRVPTLLDSYVALTVPPRTKHVFGTPKIRNPVSTLRRPPLFFSPTVTQSCRSNIIEQSL